MADDAVRQLVDRGFINADLSVRAVLAASDKIPGIGGPNPVAWELITRDYVYKGLEEGSGAITGDVVAAIAESGIFNFDVTLRELVEVSAEMIRPPGEDVSWELISRDFVLRGKDPAIVRGEVLDVRKY